MFAISQTELGPRKTLARESSFVALGVDVGHLMYCAREGQLAASAQLPACSHATATTPPADAVAVVTSILKDRLLLDPAAIATLAAHLHSCCPRHVGPSELAVTLQAMEVLVQERQVEAIVGCGLTSWLLGVLEEMSEVGETGVDMLSDVITLLKQAVSVILVALTKGWLS